MAIKKVKLPNNTTLDINDARNVVIGDGADNIVTLTNAEYQALATKDPNTVYIITDVDPGGGGGGGGSGTVTSVAMSVPTGLSVSGSPITTSGTLAVSFANGYSIPTTTKQSQWDAKQAELVSGTNIKTINNQSLLGSGNITISGGGGDTSTCVHITGDETVGGDKTFTDDIVVGSADNIKYSGGGGGGGFTRGATNVYMDATAHSLSFSVDGEPKAFVLSCGYLPFYDSFGVLMVVGDSTGLHGIYNTGSQHNYSAGFTKSYSNGTITITAPNGVDFGDAQYWLVYYYGEGSLTFKTSTIQPGSGVTAVTLTGTDLTEVPAMYAIFLETQVNNEQYRRVAGYTNSAYSGSAVAPMGITFLTGGPVDTTSSFTATYQTGYSAGLNINSGGTNAGGYFHNPGTYTLYYLMASDVAGGGSGGYQSLGDELDDKYTLPSSGIPKSDLASAVQTSLGKADTALQSYTETDPTVPSWAKASSKPTYTASEVGALPDTTVVPTESTVSGWGFTKNAGTITGITMNGSSKGTSGVVNLGTVVTSESDPVFTASAAHGISSTDISNWNAKQKAITVSSSAPTSSQGSNGDIWIVI